MKKKNFLSSIIFCALCGGAFAQQTGDFSVGFPSPDTLLTNDSLYIYFHVPVSYQPGVPAKMIVGIHGLGNPKTPEQIRNYLAPTGDSIGAIVVCPAPYLGEQPRSKLVVNIAVDSVLTWYAVDTNEIYIAGYSAGSDVASQYTLDQPEHRMKGLIWYAPGFFYQPNLSTQTDFPPTCLCYGDQDPLSNFLGQVTAIRDSFENSPFYFFYNEIPGVAHTMEFPGFTREMLECLRFIDDPENFVPDTIYSSEKVIAQDYLNMFPNPSTGKVTVDLKGKENFTFRLMDLCGRIVFEINDWRVEKQVLDLRGYRPGTYILNVQTKDACYFRQFILLP